MKFPLIFFSNRAGFEPGRRSRYKGGHPLSFFVKTFLSPLSSPSSFVGFCLCLSPPRPFSKALVKYVYLSSSQIRHPPMLLVGWMSKMWKFRSVELIVLHPLYHVYPTPSFIANHQPPHTRRHIDAALAARSPTHVFTPPPPARFNYL